MAKFTFDAGMKLLVANRHEALYARAVEALRDNEKNPLAFFFLGILASTIGQEPKALELFAKATEHGSENVRYQSYHAKTLIALGYKAEAKLRADIATKIGTSDAFIADMIGTVYSRAGRHDLALPMFKKAVQLNSKWAVFHFNLAASAQFLGDFDLATNAFEKAVSIDPRLFEAWFALVGLDTQTQDNNKLATLTSLFEAETENADGQLLLGHAIAKTLEDLGRYEESFDWLEKAKALKRAQIEYSREDQARVFKAAKAAPTTPLTTNSARADHTPIFIVGLPRTGTTLVDRILSSHRNIASAGELNILPELIRREMEAGGGITTRANVFQAAPEQLLDAAQAYMNCMSDLKTGAKHVIDKTPQNFFYAGLIHRMLPAAKIIALRRGAMDSCLSNYRQLFAQNTRQYDYAFDLEDIADYYREFDALITHWRTHLPADRFIVVRYEDIVFDQENQSRRLVSFCGLEWDPACLRFHENTAPVDSASSVQVRRPLNAEGIDRWKKYGRKLDNLKTALGKFSLE